MLDIGRKYFPPEVIQQWLDAMASLGFDLLHLHFSENQRFGIESALIKANPKAEPPLTKFELKQLVAYAANKGIQVMGEIGMPGHMGAVLKNYPHLQLLDSPNNLDITQPESLALCKALIDEFLPLFTAAQWHVGGDEYLPLAAYSSYTHLADFAQQQTGINSAIGADAKLWFLQQLSDHLAINGAEPRAWGDDLTGSGAVALPRSLVVDWWASVSPLDPATSLPTPEYFLSQGLKVCNCGWAPCYWVLSDKPLVAKGFPRSTPAGWVRQNQWQSNCFQGGGARYMAQAIHNPQLAGTKLQVWCDQPDLMQADAILPEVLPLMRALAEASR